MVRRGKMQPKISVIIPIFNVEKYLEETMESIINQTIGINNIQVIMVNDGSNDGSKEIIKTYESKYANIKSIHFANPSGAAGRPRNEGVKYAKGKYIIFVDPDDICYLDAFEKLYNSIEKYNSDVVMGKFLSFNKHGEKDNFEKYDIEPFINQDISLCSEILKAPHNLNCRIFRNDFIRQHKLYFPEGVIAQDAVFTINAFLAAEKISFIDEYIFKYRVRTEIDNPSVTQKRNLKYFSDFSYIRKIIIGLYRKYRKVDYFEVRYLGDLNWLLDQMQFASSMTENEKKEAIDIIMWFIDLINDNKEVLEKLDYNKQEFINSIIRRDIDNAISFMNKNYYCESNKSFNLGLRV